MSLVAPVRQGDGQSIARYLYHETGAKESAVAPRQRRRPLRERQPQSSLDSRGAGQSALAGNWGDRQIQLSVLVPFHFMPGNDPKHPWMTTRDSPRAQALVKLAAGDPFHLGIALHMYQDTFSHENFSGWREDLNSCFPWYFVESTLPNVGHAELRVVPDVVNYVWTDPRSGKLIDNKLRTMSAAKATFDFLAQFFNPGISTDVWAGLEPELRRIFALDSYDKRIDELCPLARNKSLDYKVVNEPCMGKNKADFVRAASKHLSEAVRLFDGLPRPS